MSDMDAPPDSPNREPRTDKGITQSPSHPTPKLTSSRPDLAKEGGWADDMEDKEEREAEKQAAKDRKKREKKERREKAKVDAGEAEKKGEPPKTACKRCNDGSLDWSSECPKKTPAASTTSGTASTETPSGKNKGKRCLSVGQTAQGSVQAESSTATQAEPSTAQKRRRGRKDLGAIANDSHLSPISSRNNSTASRGVRAKSKTPANSRTRSKLAILPKPKAVPTKRAERGLIESNPGTPGVTDGRELYVKIPKELRETNAKVTTSSVHSAFLNAAGCTPAGMEALVPNAHKGWVMTCKLVEVA